MKKRNGFSIVSALIAAGIISGLGLVLATLSQQQTAISKKGYQDVSTSGFLNQVRKIVDDGADCTDRLTASGTDLITPKPMSTTALEAFGDDYKIGSYIDGATKAESQSKIKILGFFTAKQDQTNDLSVDKKHKFNLVVKLLRESKGTYGPKKFHKTIPFLAETEGQKIKTCIGLDGTTVVNNDNSDEIAAEVCTQIGGQMIGGECNIDDRFRGFCESMNGQYNADTNSCDTSGILEQFCDSVGGNWNAQTNKCTGLPSNDDDDDNDPSKCAPGEVHAPSSDPKWANLPCIKTHSGSYTNVSNPCTGSYKLYNVSWQTKTCSNTKNCGMSSVNYNINGETGVAYFSCTVPSGGQSSSFDYPSRPFCRYAVCQNGDPSNPAVTVGECKTIQTQSVSCRGPVSQ